MKADTGYCPQIFHILQFFNTFSNEKEQQVKILIKLYKYLQIILSVHLCKDILNKIFILAILKKILVAI